MNGFDEHLDNYGDPGPIAEPEPTDTEHDVAQRDQDQTEDGSVADRDLPENPR